ncbi:MAG: hypothetical protein SGILL_003010 [Bacillariaceae sp.]
MSATDSSSTLVRQNDGSSQCQVPIDECCANVDCLLGDDVCVHRNCIDNAYLRITLKWVGNDDLDLFVITPEGQEISINNEFDPVSLGRFGGDADQLGSRYRVETVSFPIDGARSGKYTFYVQPLIVVEGSDGWTIDIVEDGKTVLTESGYGGSPEFWFFRQSQPSLPTTEPVQSPSVPSVGSPAMSANPISAPTVPPTRQPQPDGDCGIITSECCEDQDCPSSLSFCVQRTCITDGNPRMTLLWEGENSLTLFVRTPDGIEISADNSLDEVSGGRCETDADQSFVGPHVESCYFPLLGSPTGIYEYGVRSLSQNGVSTQWYLELYEGGDLVETRNGSGTSAIFAYARSNSIEGPERPVPTPPQCSLDENECCTDSDCSSGEICSQRMCANEGSLRISLEYIGDDDYDLVVQTPNGDMISRIVDYDPESGGRFGDTPQSSNFDFQLEYVYFPTSGAPMGSYEFFVESFATRGVGADVWKVRIYEFGELIQEETGIGTSRTLTYERVLLPTPPVSLPSLLPNPPSPQVSSPPSPNSMGRYCPDTYECCLAADCSDVTQQCIQRTCISTGALRYDLAWTGNDDLSLVVVTPSPSQNAISFQNPFDEASGGRFQQDPYQPDFGFHVESILFPASPPIGTYSFFVRATVTVENEDRWTLKVYNQNLLVAVEAGTGGSRTYTYDYQSIGLPVPSNPPFPPSVPSPPSNAPSICGNGISCNEGTEVCIQGECANEGNPRFSLQWTGDDNLGLMVTTPGGVAINAAFPFDPVSEGAFETNSATDEDGVQDGFGKHLESIFFPLEGGPTGVYRYSVTSPKIVGSEDSWVLSVAVGGNDVEIQRGSGASGVFSFRYGGIGPPSPTAMPALSPSFPPTLDQQECDAAVVQCCSTDDCFPSESCTFETCVDEGNPRFTLSWEGSNDLDLYVVTPLFGSVISFSNTEDPLSGGMFGEEFDQYDFGKHVENIYFPLDGGPPGEYSFYVRSFLADGIDDVYTVRVYVDGQEEMSITGTGDSDKLTYVYQPSEPDNECNIQEQECCNDFQCAVGLEVCTQQTCIDIGFLRFTLAWNGSDDLDLTVQTAVGTEVSFVNPLDEETGGVFGEGGSQPESGNHVENVYFPSSDIPTGTYLYSVAVFEQRGAEPDEWTISVFLNNEMVDVRSGTGDSDAFVFLLTDGDIEGPPPDPDCNPSLNECCIDADCAATEACAMSFCVRKGNLRFTLTVVGDDTIDLTVVTPLGSTVSVSNTNDPLTTGAFEEKELELGFVGPSVQNVFFSEGPAGTYTYFISTFDLNGDADEWTVKVYEGDVEKESFTGSGNANFLYEFGSANAPTPLPVVTTNPTPSPAPIAACQTPGDDCCEVSDCNDGEVCRSRTCIADGSPRFSLAWFGVDDYDLAVTAPTGGRISLLNQVDEESGGRFGENGVQMLSGFQVENIFFPEEGGPVGLYTVEISALDDALSDPPATWNLEVAADGEVVQTQSGAGVPDPIEFLYVEVKGNIRTSTLSETTCLANQSIGLCCDDDDSKETYLKEAATGRCPTPVSSMESKLTVLAFHCILHSEFTHSKSYHSATMDNTIRGYLKFL